MVIENLLILIPIMVLANQAVYILVVKPIVMIMAITVLAVVAIMEVAVALIMEMGQAVAAQALFLMAEPQSLHPVTYPEIF